MKRVVMLVYIGLIGGSTMLQSCDKDNPAPNGGVNGSDTTNVDNNSDTTDWGGGNNNEDSTDWSGGNSGGGSNGEDSTYWGGGNPSDSTIFGGN